VVSYIFEQRRSSMLEQARGGSIGCFLAPDLLTRRNYAMATAPTYAEQPAIPREKTPIENLMDFSFDRMLTPRMLKMLYGVHLLIGLIAAVWFVFSGFQRSTANGLLALILCSAGMLLWIVYCRIVVELLAVVFRVGHAITNSQN
jgi:hypothetical protein